MPCSPRILARVRRFTSFAGWLGGALLICGSSAADELRIPVAAGADPAAALQQAREARAADPSRPVALVFADGVHHLAQPLMLTPEDSGTAAAPLRLIAAEGAKPVLSAGRRIDGFRVVDGRWQARVEGPRFEQLWVNDRRAVPARAPNEGFFQALSVTETAEGDQFLLALELGDDALAFLRALDPAELSHVQLLAYHKWDNTRRFIGSLEGNRLLTRGRSMKPWNPIGTDSGLVFEHLASGLDQPGEWHLAADGTLTYLPLPGEDPEAAEVIAPGTEQLLVIRGTPDAPVSHIEIRGLSFRHAGWTSPPGGFEPAQAAAPIEAVIQVDHARSLRFVQCEVAHTGIYGIWLRDGCRDIRIEQCHLHDLGAGGVRIGSTSQGRETGGNTIDNCIIRDAGRVFPCAVGIWIGHSGGNTVTHNSISHLPYTGISVGWRWGYDASEAKNNRIEFNHIHHIGDGLLSDMGGVYTLGPSEGTVVSHNRIHDIVSRQYGGWGLYNDEGSTGVLMENNLVYRTATGGYHQHYGKENIIRNNIFAFARDHQLQFTRPEDHLSFRFTRNIVIWEDGRLWSGSARGGGRFEIDHNLLWRINGQEINSFGRSLDEWREAGHDRNSVVADPGFADAAADDFRIPDETTVSRIGFKPFDPNLAGVRGPAEWQALAAGAPPTVEPPQTTNANPRAGWQFNPDPTLPDVLILGDSISIGYTRPVRDLLKDRANVFRPMAANGRNPENCGDTPIGLARIDRWLGDREWKVIHFNWGLWDLCYRSETSTAQGRRDKVNGTISVPLEEYEQNLERLVARLKATGAKLVWASTTVVPEGEVGRFVGDDVKYNAVARRVMERHRIPINDLHATSAAFPEDHFVGPGDVHFTEEGSARLAEQVAEAIGDLLD